MHVYKNPSLYPPNAWPPMYINAKEIKGDSSCMGAKRAKGGKSTDPRVEVTLWELREQR